MKKYLTLAFTLVLTLGVFAPQAAFAVDCSIIGDPVCGTGNHCNTTAGLCEPNVTGGAGGGGTGGLNTSRLQAFATSISSLINNVAVPLLTAVAFIVFLWGVFNYFILGGADDEKRTKGRTFVMYGIIGFVLIFSIWGIVNVAVSLLDVGTGVRPAGLPYPTL
jgi:Type IV secretion system pilin